MKESDQERRMRLRDEVAMRLFVAAVVRQLEDPELSVGFEADSAWDMAGTFVGKDPELYPGAAGAWAGNASQEDA